MPPRAKNSPAKCYWLSVHPAASAPRFRRVLALGVRGCGRFHRHRHGQLRSSFGGMLPPPAAVHQGNGGCVYDCRRVVDEVLPQHSWQDILMNNAGITIDPTVLELQDLERFRVLAVNLSGGRQRHRSD